MASKVVKSDRPCLIEEHVRKKRAERIMEVFEEITESKLADRVGDSTTLEWLERCLLAHEEDTLIMIIKDSHGKPN